MSLSSLLEYLLLHCHHKTCEVCYFCLSEFFHTCRQAASVTAHCESLSFILNELFFQLEERQNKGIRTTQSWRKEKELINIYLLWSCASEDCLESESFLAQTQVTLCLLFFDVKESLLPVMSGPAETWYESEVSLLQETKSRMGNKWEIMCSGLSFGSSSQVHQASIH